MRAADRTSICTGGIGFTGLEGDGSTRELTPVWRLELDGVTTFGHESLAGVLIVALAAVATDTTCVEGLCAGHATTAWTAAVTIPSA